MDIYELFRDQNTGWHMPRRNIGDETWDALVTVVKEASRVNLAQADLRARIEELGEAAVAIARRVPGLAGVLG